jgi:hypothetical protein
MYVMKNASEKHHIVKGEVGESVSSKLQVVLKRNSVFSTFTNVCKVLNGDDVDPPEDTASEKIPLLKYLPVTSCDVERSFLAYKHILSDKRKSINPENKEKILIVYYASKNQ